MKKLFALIIAAALCNAAMSQSYWLNYAKSINTSKGSTPSKSIQVIFPDTLVKAFEYNSQLFSNPNSTRVNFHMVANVLDVLSPAFKAADGIDWNSTTTFKVDSMGVGYIYKRKYSVNNILDNYVKVVDTLMVYLYTNKTASDLPTKSYTGFQNAHGYNTINIKQQKYDYLNNKPTASGIVLVKVPLTENDETEGSTDKVKYFAIKTPLAVGVGQFVASVIGFKPGYTYKNGDTITKNKNYFCFVSLEENGPNTYPTYTPGDFNISSLITNNERYNNSFFNGFFVPTYVWGGGQIPAWQFEHHLIDYKVTRTGGSLNPKANFGFSTTDLSVSFADSSKNTPTSWLWEFGDQSTSAEQSPSHTYARAGTYPVKLIATNGAGSDSITQTVTVVSGIEAPKADFAFTIKALDVSFNDRSTNIPTSWQWTFGDGEISGKQNPAHTYKKVGSYSVCLRTTNEAGTDSICKNVTVDTASFESFWLNFGDDINTYNQTTGTKNIQVIFPDTLVNSFEYNSQLFSNPNSTKVNFHMIGNVLDVLSPAFKGAKEVNWNTTTTYKIDSMGVGYVYKRKHPDPAIVDTLVVYLYNNHTNSDLPTRSYSGYQNAHGYNTISIKQQKYSYLTNKPTASGIITAKVPLTASDVTEGSIERVKYFAIPTPLDVGADKLAASAISFKPGYTYKDGDTISKNKNYFCFVSLEENGPNTYPTYTPNDFNVSSLITNNERYNTAGSFGPYFVPTYVWGGGFTPAWQFEHHLVYYKVTRTGGSEVPSVKFGFTATGLSVSFKDSSANAPTSWEWNFGDNETSVEQNPTHAYKQSGTYEVCLVATNAAGSDTLCKNVTVTGISQGMAIADADQTVIYPNPANRELYVFYQFPGKAKMEIINVYGQVVAAVDLIHSNSSVDVSAFQSGVYELKITFNNGMVTKKIEVIH